MAGMAIHGRRDTTQLAPPNYFTNLEGMNPGSCVPFPRGNLSHDAASVIQYILPTSEYGPSTDWSGFSCLLVLEKLLVLENAFVIGMLFLDR